ncbi:hypothetical protein IPZ58_27910 [Streptomyces roseoverticillatus]|uniref:hypothetical protein n=1 Tax=Streptomyces roseoverticillatus TaxID=66429 RepID=UPI001F203647|nr:hypothetical protein [Streptomyces roseoverticillatus]MCF3105386.1 hypothetical protein [Streptomyces roseoverticillatus]
MTETPLPLARQTEPAAWDQATFRCDQCGAQRAAATEADYLEAVSAHRDAHAVLAQLNPIERNGLVSILRVILASPELGFEILALTDHKKAATGRPQRTDGSLWRPNPNGAGAPHRTRPARPSHGEET